MFCSVQQMAAAECSCLGFVLMFSLQIENFKCVPAYDTM